MPKDFKLSEHFSFFELTITSNEKLLNQNRKEAEIFLDSLKAMALMLEIIRPNTGPLSIHSCFRCLALNGATIGSSKTSQHPKGEATDFSRPGESNEELIDDLFKIVLNSLISTGTSFGQLIKESAKRDYGQVNWVHLSLGIPFRAEEVCGQVMEMKDGLYHLIKVIPIGR